jgi:plasmid stabilization system protein ParE
MIPYTVHARAQIQGLYKHYLKRKRYEAHVNLTKALRAARARIESDPHSGEPYPSKYHALARWQYLWLKEHRYWIAWSNRRGYPVITNVFYDTSAMWRRVRPDSGRLVP